VQAQHFGAGHVLDDLLAELHRVLIDDEVRGAALRHRPKHFGNGTSDVDFAFRIWVGTAIWSVLGN
jgi:hypothetical protein